MFFPARYFWPFELALLLIVVAFVVHGRAGQDPSRPHLVEDAQCEP